MKGTRPADNFLPILTFHDIGEHPSPWCLPPATLAALLAWLRRHRFQILTMDKLAAHYRQLRPIAPPAVALTFDDARAGVYAHARRMLADHQMHATIYPVAAWTHAEPLPAHEAYGPAMDLHQLRQLHHDGHQIGYHSARHDCYRTLPEAAIHHDLTIIRRNLEEELGAPIRHFSYPYGHHDPRVDHLLHTHGRFDTIVTNARTTTPDPLCHGRISIKRNIHPDPETFAALFTPAAWRPRAPITCTHTPPRGETQDRQPAPVNSPAHPPPSPKDHPQPCPTWPSHRSR